MKRIIAYILSSLLLISLHHDLAAQDGGLQSSLSQSPTSQNKISLQLKATLMRQGSKVSAVVLSSDSRILAATIENGKTELWNTANGQLIATLDGRIFLPAYHRDFQPINAFSQDGRALATMKGKEAKLWDALTGQLKHILRGHQGEVRSTAFSPDGRSLATLSADGTVKLWETETGQLKVTLAAFQVKKYPRWRIISRALEVLFDYGDAYFSPDNRHVLTVPYKQATKLWDATTGQLEAVLGETNAEATFSPSGRFVLTRSSEYSGMEIHADLWETETGRLKASFTLPFFSAEFSHHERWIGPVNYRGKRGLLNLKTMEVEIPLDMDDLFSSQLLFSPDDRTFLAASGLNQHMVTLLDTSAGKVIASFRIVAKEGFDLISDYLKYVERLSFHPGSRILMGANQKLVRFWDTQSGRQIRELTEGRDPAIFSSDGKLLVTAGKDRKNILLWEIKM